MREIVLVVPAVAVVLAAVLLLGGFGPQDGTGRIVGNHSTAQEKLPPCVTEERLVKVRGSSLSGLIEPGETLKLLAGYYKCMPVERGDIVAYNYAGNDVPVIKVVKGTEGDGFALQANGSCWNIMVNGEIVKNSQGIPYCIGEQGYRMLHLYEVDYKGVIPPGASLLLGNAPSGTTDSTRFGLVDKSDFAGKIVKAG